MSDNAVARLFRSAPVTCSVGALLIAVWLLQAIEARSITRTAAGPVTDAFLVRGPEVIVEPLGALRTLTAVLIHLGLGHLVVNLALFFFVGREIERRLPGGFYLATFVLSGLGSSLAIIVFDPLVPTAGASGAIFGLMAVFVATAFRAGLDVRAPLILLGINIAYTSSPLSSLVGPFSTLRESGSSGAELRPRNSPQELPAAAAGRQPRIVFT